MKKSIMVFCMMFVLCLGLNACKPGEPTSDEKMNQQQEEMSNEAVKQAGMPGIKNFTVKKTMKMILEKQDEANLVTYAYVYSPMIGKFTYVGSGFGFPIPYSTQYTNPMKHENHGQWGITLPQADPTGVWSPAAADATWWLRLNPTTKTIEASYMEEKINVFPSQLPARLVIQ